MTTRVFWFVVLLGLLASCQKKPKVTPQAPQAPQQWKLVFYEPFEDSKGQFFFSCCASHASWYGIGGAGSSDTPPGGGNYSLHLESRGESLQRKYKVWAPSPDTGWMVFKMETWIKTDTSCSEGIYYQVNGMRPINANEWENFEGKKGNFRSPTGNWIQIQQIDTLYIKYEDEMLFGFFLIDSIRHNYKCNAYIDEIRVSQKPL